MTDPHEVEAHTEDTDDTSVDFEATQTPEDTEATEQPEQPAEEAPMGEQEPDADVDKQEDEQEDEEEDPLAQAAAALGDTDASEEEAAEAEYRSRLRSFTRELKKQPGIWYIIQTYSGHENKVKTNLDMRAQTLEVDEFIHEVVVPIEQVIELRDGKRKQIKRKLLPGYVLVRMDMNDSAWSVVRETPGVTSFVGNEGNATPVKHRDVAKFLMPKEAKVEGDGGADTSVNSDGEMVVAMPDEQEKPKMALDFEVGDAVTILTGALASVSASISEIDHNTGKIQALVSIFGRETPVELTADQIEKIM